MSFRFIATQGVEFCEEVKKDRKSVLETWAHFIHSREHDTPDGQKRYVFSTDDVKVAERLRGVDCYGITEMPADEPEPVEPEPVEPPAPPADPAA